MGHKEDQSQQSADSSARLSPAKQAATRVGTDLNSKWRIDRVLGVGGMGAVFAATHKNNGTQAAIKVLHHEFARNREVFERFLREGRIANRIDHPAAVKVVDDGESSVGEPFLVMELLEGMTLAELMKRGGSRMPVDKLLSIFDTVLDLLGKCHEIAIVHRDIKPANIFLSKQGPVRVLDFGVARMREPDSGIDATRAGIALGTASFIAPEQALGMEVIDGRADVFSVGACLYAQLAGERLHTAKSEAEEFVLAATQAAPSVARKAKDLAPELVALVDKALAYDRNQRFQSAQEMRAELLKLMAGLRAGRIKTAQKKQTGLVVRGKDAIEEGAAFDSPEELKEALHLLTNVFKQLGVAMMSIRQYGFSHPQTQRALAQARADIGTALAANAYAVRWDVTTTAFTFEGAAVWAPDRVPFDRIPHQLFADGIRKVQFKVGITEDEIRDFLVILLRDASSIFSTEDDSVTAMWDRRFEHVAYLAVDSFADGGEILQSGEDAAEWNALAERAIAFARIDKDFEDTNLESQAAEINISGMLVEAGESAARLAVDDVTRASLGAQLATPPERWLDSYLVGLVPSYMEAKKRNELPLLHGALAEWTTDQVKLRSADRVFEMHHALAEAFRAQKGDAVAKEVERTTAELMFSLDTLREIMGDIASERWSGDGVQIAAPPQLTKGLAHALELLNSDAVFALACECLDSSRSASLKEVLVPYVRKWSAGQEATLGSMLRRSGPEMGKILIELLGNLKTPLAQQAIESAFVNPNLEVKLACLAHIGDAVGDRAREEIANLLDAPDVDVRQKTLELVAKLGVTPAGPVLVRRIQSDTFHDLSVDERRSWLTALHTLKASRAESVAIEVLTKRRLLSGDAVEQTRALAADMLAAQDTDEALKALDETLKQRWGTSAAVREAAQRAAATIRTRSAARARASAAEGKGA